MLSLPEFYDRRHLLKSHSRGLATKMYRQYPYNSNVHPSISLNSFNIQGLNYITILNEELVEVTGAFWNHSHNGPCNIRFDFNKIPAGRNYICLCNVDTDHYNRIFLEKDQRNYRIKATCELNKKGLVGLILQFIPIAQKIWTWSESGLQGLWISRVPTLQFLAAGYLSEEESRTLHHLPTNSETSKDCLRKKCYQIEVWYDLLLDPWIGQTCICNGASMYSTRPQN